MPRQRMYNTVRTDMLEGYIGFYEAYERHDAAGAIRRLAKEIHAPIDEERIVGYKATHRIAKERDS